MKSTTDEYLDRWIGVRLPNSLFEQVAQLSKHSKQTMSAILREALATRLTPPTGRIK